MTVKSTFAKPIFLGAATRTPIGKFGGSLKSLTAAQLATRCLQEAQRRAPEALAPDLVLLGHARQAGGGPNTARQATCFSGVGEKVPAITINQACASGLTAILTAADKVSLGRARSVWAGGVESMSNTPFLLMQARWGQKMGHSEIKDAMYQDGLHCPMADMIMGATVENFVVPEYKVTREEQDAFALRSQQRAAKAWEAGHFASEVFALPAEGRFPGLATDEHMRPQTTLAELQKLKPVFDTSKGSITAGNASGITDGAAFVHVSSERGAHAMVEILDYEMAAIDPKLMGVAPVPAIEALLKRHGLKVTDLAAVEINEAFAAQVIACQRTLKIPEEKLNARGGAIAIGHPIGGSGARITVTLLHQLKGQSGALGLAALCVSGGMGVAMLVRGL